MGEKDEAKEAVTLPLSATLPLPAPLLPLMDTELDGDPKAVKVIIELLEEEITVEEDWERKGEDEVDGVCVGKLVCKGKGEGVTVHEL